MENFGRTTAYLPKVRRGKLFSSLRGSRLRFDVAAHVLLATVTTRLTSHMIVDIRSMANIIIDNTCML